MEGRQDCFKFQGIPKLSSLPEIIIRILGYVDPIDIITMRKTSREIYSVTKSRIVWLVALDRICERHGIFKPTFPMEKMTTQELEHAALSPYRFVELVKAGDNANYRGPYQTRILRSFRKPTPVSAANTYTYNGQSTICLVPGGRFLFTSGDEHICLWDLGHISTVPAKPFPIATIEHSKVSLKAVAPSPGGDAFTIAVDCDGTLTMYHVDPCMATVEFSLQGQLELEEPWISDALYVQFSGGLALIYGLESEEVMLWNWAEQTGCKWHYLSTASPYMTLFLDQSVLAIDNFDTLAIWDTPPLYPLPVPTISQMVDVENEEKFRQRYPGSRNSCYTITASSNWQHSLPRHMCLLLNPDQEVSDALSLYSIQARDSSSSSAFLPAAFPAPGGCSSNVYGNGSSSGDFFEGSSDLFGCDDSLVLCTGSNQGSLVATVLPIPTKATFRLCEPRSITLTHAMDAQEFERPDRCFGFCPMSGRLVFFSEGFELRVSDYVLPVEELINGNPYNPSN